jgi:phenylpropionate dioxygenase-like ring-hydroxylating dioxygenase large terminal subunit
VASAAEITTVPRPVTVGGERLALLRLTADGPVAAFRDHCPHRLVPLTAGTVADGRIRCAYHGWEFAADGGCADLPSLGPGARVPPRARLDPVEVREESGQVWVRARPATTDRC